MRHRVDKARTSARLPLRPALTDMQKQSEVPNSLIKHANTLSDGGKLRNVQSVRSTTKSQLYVNSLWGARAAPRIHTVLYFGECGSLEYLEGFSLWSFHILDLEESGRTPLEWSN